MGMKRTVLVISVVLSFLFSLVVGTVLVNVVKANPGLFLRLRI